MTDLTKCPNCGGEADNGHDRCMPPNVYFCTKCNDQPERSVEEMVETNTAITASIHKNDMDGFTLVATFSTKELADKAKKMVLQPHQELQKAREQWLREEIVKLEGMKVKNEHNSECLHNEAPEYCDCDNYIKWNKALQTIIDRYQSELDQPIG